MLKYAAREVSGLQWTIRFRHHDTGFVGLRPVLVGLCGLPRCSPYTSIVYLLTLYRRLPAREDVVGVVPAARDVRVGAAHVVAGDDGLEGLSVSQ